MKISRLILIIIFCLFVSGCSVKNQSVKPVNETNPSWIQKMIIEAPSRSVENPATVIKKCQYNNQTVYYILSPCCDRYNYLYDENKNVICAPDGGITGRGDGHCTDFSLTQNNCELIWQDNRSR